MIRTFFVSAAVATLGFAAPAFADGSYYHYGPYGGYAHGSYHTAPGHASRSFSAQGIYGGAATLNGSCTRGAGCTRDWSRTLRNGATASGSVSVQRGVGVIRASRARIEAELGGILSPVQMQVYRQIVEERRQKIRAGLQ